MVWVLIIEWLNTLVNREGELCFCSAGNDKKERKQTRSFDCYSGFYLKHFDHHYRIPKICAILQLVRLKKYAIRIALRGDTLPEHCMHVGDTSKAHLCICEPGFSSLWSFHWKYPQLF